MPCENGMIYTNYYCSPSVVLIKVVLTLNNFEDGGAKPECDKNYHSDDTPGWHYQPGGNGQIVQVMVVDECDSTKGCDGDHDYQLLMPLKLCGRLWEFQHRSGATWIYSGLIDFYHINIYDCGFQLCARVVDFFSFKV